MERYEIGDRLCGVIALTNTKGEAFDQAIMYQTTSHTECTVTVFDRMAHRGKPDTWGYAKAVGLWGFVLHTRPIPGYARMAHLRARIYVPSPQAR